MEMHFVTQDSGRGAQQVRLDTLWQQRKEHLRMELTVGGKATVGMADGSGLGGTVNRWAPRKLWSPPACLACGPSGSRDFKSSASAPLQGFGFFLFF